MKFLKISRWEIVILVVILIVGSTTLYYRFLLSDQLTQIKQLDEDIQAANQEIKLKDAELEKVDDIREEIAQIGININQSEMKLIPFKETPKKMILLNDYVKLNNLYLEKLEFSEPVEQSIKNNKDKESEEINSQKYYKIGIKLEIIGQYENFKVFLEEIKSTIKPFNIDKVEISPKDDVEEELYDVFNKKNGEYISAKVELSTYALSGMDKQEGDILNYNFMEYEYKYDNPFKNIESAEEQMEKLINHLNDGISKDNPQKDTEDDRTTSNPTIKDFKIAIKDAYASGDNFYIVGPGELGDYTIVQTRTEKPVTFNLTLNPTGYSYGIRAKDQEEKFYQKEMPLEQCRLIIDSTVMAIRNNQELSSSIYITNNTGKLLNVDIKGNFTEKIFIYSSDGTLINPGETKGNIAVGVH
ncbi:MAG: hypothetical protein GX308_02200 [Epulopiscium sp.]|nr:hypothetical protein [Candidatus Epulonipiscium sp.]